MSAGEAEPYLGKLLPLPRFVREGGAAGWGDIVDGLVAIIGRDDKIDGEIINLGTDEINTTREGIALVEEIMQRKLIIENRPPRKGDQLKTAAVIDKARLLLDYEPKTTLREGLEEQVNWYLQKFS